MGLKSVMSSLLRGRDASAADEAEAPPKPLYPAVSIKPGRPACEAATAAAGQRMLAKHVRKLPLHDCTMAEGCTCAFVKHPDRRDGEKRRLFGWDGTTDWYGENNRRKKRGRRIDDL